MGESELRDQIRGLVAETLMLSTPAAEIRDDLPLFGPEGLGLDSVDALQLVVALDKHYGLKITDTTVARETLQSVATMAAAVLKHQQSAS